MCLSLGASLSVCVSLCARVCPYVEAVERFTDACEHGGVRDHVRWRGSWEEASPYLLCWGEGVRVCLSVSLSLSLSFCGFLFLCAWLV